MYTRSLQFTYLMEEDEGRYTCNVMILETSRSQSIDLITSVCESLCIIAVDIQLYIAKPTIKNYTNTLPICNAFVYPSAFLK